MMLMNPVQHLYQTCMKTHRHDTQHARTHPPNSSPSTLGMLFTRAWDTPFRQGALANGEANFKFSICKEVSWKFLQYFAPSYTYDLSFQGCLRNGVYRHHWIKSTQQETSGLPTGVLKATSRKLQALCLGSVSKEYTGNPKHPSQFTPPLKHTLW